VQLQGIGYQFDFYNLKAPRGTIRRSKDFSQAKANMEIMQHGVGGEDGHLMIDMKLFYNISLDSTTNIATVGPGARLGNLALELFEQGERAVSHGICPG
jgi:hypothetical protein